MYNCLICAILAGKNKRVKVILKNLGKGRCDKHLHHLPLHVAYNMIQPDNVIIEMLQKFDKSADSIKNSDGLLPIDHLFNNLSDSFVSINHYFDNNLAFDHLLIRETWYILSYQLRFIYWNLNCSSYYQRYNMIADICQSTAQIPNTVRSYYESDILRDVHSKLQNYVNRLIFLAIWKYRPTILSLLYGDLIKKIIEFSNRNLIN